MIVSRQRMAVVRALEENVGKPLSVTELSKIAGVSPETTRSHIRHCQHYSESYPTYWPQVYLPVHETFTRGCWHYWIGERAADR